MNTKLALLTSCALLLGTMTAEHAAADGVLFNYQLVPGPSGYRGPLPRQAGPVQGQPAPPVLRQPPVTVDRRYADRPWIDVGPGEPDETGRVGPTVQTERDPDGKLPPTYRPQ
jgi:hypothetical protein